MKRKPVVPREIANGDVDEAVEHYLAEGAEGAALDLIDALESAYRLLERHPGAGSPRVGLELGIPELRALRLKRFPYLVLYREQPTSVDVWRVLHERRDMPEWLLVEDTP